MSKKHNFIDAKRRGLMQSSILVSGAAVAATKVADAGTLKLPDTVLPESEKKSVGYRETDQVREYYRKARF